MSKQAKRFKLSTISPLYKCKSKQCATSLTPPIVVEVNSHRTDIQCQTCSNKWIICTICKKRFSNRKISIAEDHFQSQHKTDHLRDDDIGVPDDIFDDMNNDYDINTRQSDIMIDPIVEIDKSTLPESSKKYLKNETISKNNGMKTIIGCSFAQSQYTLNEPTTEETDLHLHITKFLFEIPTTLHKDFLTILQKSQQQHQFVATRLPVLENDISKIYTTGKYAIYNSLPIPKIVRNDQHAYVSMKQIIEYHVAFCCQEQPLTLHSSPKIDHHVHEIVNCFKARQLKNNHIMMQNHSSSTEVFLYLVIWSDDFEPNHIRKNKHSTWIRTVTIYSAWNTSEYPDNTYVISLGHKKDHHNDLNQLMNDDLKFLNTSRLMYSNAVKKRIPVVTKLLVFSADRPERNSLNHILGHAGTTTKRWKYTAYVNQHTLPSCHECFVKRLRAFGNSSTANKDRSNNVDRCRKCSNWNFLSKSRTIQSFLTDKYPRIQQPDSPIPPEGRHVVDTQCLGPKEQNYDWLKQGCRFCFHNVFHKVWNKSISDEYMQSLGLSKNFNREYVVNKAQQLFEQNPEHLNPSATMEFPPMWNGSSDLDQHIDTPMHLLFQGVVKSVIEFTFEWIKLHNKLKPYGLFVDPIIINIKQLQCDFCRVETFSTAGDISTAGWIGESYLGFTRNICYIFSYIDRFVSEEFQREKKAFEFLHQTCSAMISRLMATEVVDISEIDDSIKLFLSAIDMCEKLTFVESREANMFWSKRSNFLCLLNLPDQIKKFGRLRNYWEGSRERVIQTIKPFMKRNRDTSSFLQIQLEKTQRIQFLSSIQNSFDLSNQMNRKYDRYRNYIFYNSHQELNNSIAAGKPLGCVKIHIDELDGIFFMIKNRRSLDLVLLVWDDMRMYENYGLKYIPIKPQEHTYITLIDMKDIYKFTHESLLCLPRIQGTLCAYSMISETWKVHNGSNDVGYPQISMSLKMWAEKELK